MKQVQEAAESFASALLAEYTEDLRKTGRTFSRKEINDSVWGTISLTPVEAALLDSPLLQRLRSIKQLGVVHWVYPGAIHTRFEHSLGVLHQVHHLTSALNTLAIQRNVGQLIDGNNLQLLRLAALLHDVGHPAFSHVSEMALESLPTINPVAAEFGRVYKAEGRKLSEIFAFFIVTSRALRDLFEVLFSRLGAFISFTSDQTTNLELVMERLGRAILGQKIDDRLPLLHEVISGPFDADKLDYFVRDAKMAGIPSVVDISRLVQKISIRELDATDLPAEIARNVNSIDQKHCIFGIRWSGVAVLDELHLTRVLLYAKIYRHPKVVAIEQMLRAAIVTLAPAVRSDRLLRMVYSFDDEALLRVTKEGLASELAIDLKDCTPDTSARLECAIAIFTAIRVRRLAVKAFQIQHRYPADPLEYETQQKEGLIDFREEIEHPVNCEEFRKRLIDEIQSILKIVSPGTAPSRIELEASVMIHALGQTPGGNQIARAFLLPTSGQPIPFREYTVNRTAWADSYMSDRPIGYIFAPAANADAVYIATEKLLRTNNGVRLPVSALEVSKRHADRIQSLKRKLSQAGYYKRAPYDIRPVPDRLSKVDVVGTVKHFADRLAKFHEPLAAGHQRPKLTSPEEHIRGWLRQFDDDEFVEHALKLLGRFRVLERADTVLAIRTFVENNPEFRGAVVVPFGSARDSGAVQTYFSADLQGSYIASCITIEELPKHPKPKAIIVVDDFVGSGSQAQDILAAGFGLKELRKNLGEERDLFDADVQEVLRSVRVGFVFTAAWDDGVKTTERIAKAAGLDATVYNHIKESEIPFAFTSNTGSEDAFRKRCEAIGRELVASMIDQEGKALKPGERESKIQDRALGYGNRAMLLASPFNVPSQTLTVFWGEGLVDGIPWTPLMVRRKKN